MNHDLPARKVYVIFNVDFRSFVNKNCLKLIINNLFIKRWISKNVK